MKGFYLKGEWTYIDDFSLERGRLYIIVVNCWKKIIWSDLYLEQLAGPFKKWGLIRSVRGAKVIPIKSASGRNLSCGIL